MSKIDMLSTLPKVKLALRLTEDDFDDQILDLMEAGLADLGIAGVTGERALVTDTLVRQAVITYCKLNFGDTADYDRLKAAYNEQKAQLSMASGFTDWGVGNAR